METLALPIIIWYIYWITMTLTEGDIGVLDQLLVTIAIQYTAN